MEKFTVEDLSQETKKLAEDSGVDVNDTVDIFNSSASINSISEKYPYPEFKFGKNNPDFGDVLPDLETNESQEKKMEKIKEAEQNLKDVQDKFMKQIDDTVDKVNKQSEARLAVIEELSNKQIENNTLSFSLFFKKIKKFFS